MRLSKRGAAFIRAHEGFRSIAYLDPVKILTIGIGFTWGSRAFREWWAKYRPGQTFTIKSTMSTAEAESALVYLCDVEYGAAVVKFLEGKVVEQHVFDAACSMVFNCGPGALEWKWAAAMKAGDIKSAAANLRVTATTAKGKKLPGLVRRRQEEAALMLTADYAGVKVQDEPAPSVVPMPSPKAAPPPEQTPSGAWAAFWAAVIAMFNRSK